MDSIVAAKVRRFLMDRFHLDPQNAGVIAGKIRSLARMAGFNLDERFASAGLGAGAEANIASNIVARALGKSGSGSATAEKDIRVAIERWTRTTPATGLN